MTNFNLSEGSVKKPVAMAVANGLQNSSTTDFSVNYNWTLPVLATVEDDLHWFDITGNQPVDATIVGYYADRYFDVPRSSLSRIVIKLPYSLDLYFYSWPVHGLDVVLVECGCYERQLIELCYQYGARTITLQEHSLQSYTLPQSESRRVAA